MHKEKRPMRDSFMVRGGTDNTAFKVTRFVHGNVQDAEEYIRVQPMYRKASTPDGEWLFGAGGLSIPLSRLNSMLDALDAVDDLHTQQFTKGALKSNNPEVPLPKGERRSEAAQPDSKKPAAKEKEDAPAKSKRPPKPQPTVEEW